MQKQMKRKHIVALPVWGGEGELRRWCEEGREGSGPWCWKGGGAMAKLATDDRLVVVALPETAAAIAISA
jgi:hypothetical protein